MNQLPGCLFAYPPRSECRDAVKIIGPKLYDTQFGFRRDRSTSEQISTLQQRNPWSMPKTWTHVLSTSGRCTTGLLVKNFGGRQGSTVLTGVFC